MTFDSSKLAAGFLDRLGQFSNRGIRPDISTFDWDPTGPSADGPRYDHERTGVRQVAGGGSGLS